MKINKTIEMEDGVVKFEGELSEEEFNIVVEAGLAILLRMGVLSTLRVTKEDEQQVVAH